MLRCWSAGCGSGEEPYSLALLWTFHVGPAFPGLSLVVVATVYGRARFAICGSRDPADVLDAWTSAPGDLVLMRGPGLAGARDGRPFHLVEGPRRGPRLSLGIRMSVGAPLA